MDASYGSDVATWQIGVDFVRRVRRIGALLGIAGLVLFIGGFVGFGIFGNGNQAIQRIGIHATAVVTDVAPYPEYRFNEHIDIEFIDRNGHDREAEIPIGENDTYRVGQRIKVAYDRRNPRRVVLARGYADIGAVGFPLFFAIVVGATLIVIAVLQLRLARHGRKALHNPAQQMTAATSRVRRGRSQVWVITLTGRDGASYRLRASARRSWGVIENPVQVAVFGDTSPRAVVVIIDPVLQRAAAGRIPRPRAARRRRWVR